MGGAGGGAWILNESIAIEHGVETKSTYLAAFCANPFRKVGEVHLHTKPLHGPPAHRAVQHSIHTITSFVQERK